MAKPSLRVQTEWLSELERGGFLLHKPSVLLAAGPGSEQGLVQMQLGPSQKGPAAEPVQKGCPQGRKHSKLKRPSQSGLSVGGIHCLSFSCKRLLLFLLSLCPLPLLWLQKLFLNRPGNQRTQAGPPEKLQPETDREGAPRGYCFPLLPGVTPSSLPCLCVHSQVGRHRFVLRKLLRLQLSGQL